MRPQWIRRAGLAGALIFFVKGVIWLLIGVAMIGR